MPNFPYGTGGHYAVTYRRDGHLSHGMSAWSQAEIQVYLQWLEE